MHQLCLLLLMALTFDLGWGQATRVPYSYLPEEMPNPQRNPRACGLPGPEPGYICDPNGIITRHECKFTSSLHIYKEHLYQNYLSLHHALGLIQEIHSWCTDATKQ
jgi:hypothetical protein